MTTTASSLPRLDGKVILLTGATEGIGKAAAGVLAERGATLVLVGRNRDKTDRVVAELRAAGAGDRIDSILGDLSVIAEIRAVAAAFKARYTRLDVLANNAGGVFTDKRITPDGLEQTFALNHLSYFLLTHELRGLLEATPGARVVSTSSGAHQMGRLADLEEVARRARGYTGWSAYGDSKLANILFTRELARRLKGTGVVANAFHPGFVRTGFGLNNQGFSGLMVRVTAKLFARTPDKGAETLVWLAASPDAAGVTGEYFHDLRVAKISKRAKDDALAASLWALSERLCGIGAAAQAK